LLQSEALVPKISSSPGSRQTISVLISIESRGLPDEATQAAAKSRRILPLSD
jgi:hypothetical protein